MDGVGRDTHRMITGAVRLRQRIGRHVFHDEIAAGKLAPPIEAAKVEEAQFSFNAGRFIAHPVAADQEPILVGQAFDEIAAMSVEVAAHGLDGDFNDLRFLGRAGQLPRKVGEHFGLSFRLLALGDVAEKNGDFPAVVSTDPKGIDVEPSVHPFHLVRHPDRFARRCDLAVNFIPILFKIRDEFADPFAQRAVHAGQFLEGRVNFQIAVIDRLSLCVVNHLDRAKAFIHRIEQIAVALFGFAHRRFGLLELGDVGATSDVAAELVFRRVTGDANIEKPAVFSIVAFEPVFHRKRCAGVEGRTIGLETVINVGGMDILGPAVSDLLLH